MNKHIDLAIIKYADLVAPIGYEVIRRDAELILDATQCKKPWKGTKPPGCYRDKGKGKKAEVVGEAHELNQGVAKKIADKLASQGLNLEQVPASKIKAAIENSPMLKGLKPDIVDRLADEIVNPQGKSTPKKVGTKKKKKEEKPQQQAPLQEETARRTDPHDSIPRENQEKFFDRFAGDGVTGKDILDGIKKFSADDLYDDFYKEVRAYEAGRDFDESRKSEIEKYSKAINSYIEKGPKFEGQIYRGLSFRTKAAQDEFLESISSGFETDAVSSWSSDRGVADEFSCCKHPVILSVGNKSGVSIKNVSRFENESEVITKRGSKYKVLSQKRVGDSMHIELEEI